MKSLLKQIYRKVTPAPLRSKVVSAIVKTAAVKSKIAAEVRYVLVPPRPAVMVLDICGVCNAQCPFCPRDYMPEARAKGFMSDEIFSKCLEEIRKHQIKRVSLYATSEPTLHPKFDEFVFKLKAEGLHVTVSTNAYTAHKHFESLAAVDYLQFSIEGWDKESYEKYRFPLKFDRVVENVRGFHEYVKTRAHRPFVNCNLILTQKVDLEAYLDIWGEYVDRICPYFLLGTNFLKDGKALTKINADIGDDYVEYVDNGSTMCTWPFDTVTVSFDGKIALCCHDFSAEMPLGNIRDGIRTVYSSPVLKKIRADFRKGRRPVVCADCTAFCKPLDSKVDAWREKIAKLNHPLKHKLSFYE